MKASERDALESRLREYEDRTGNQIVVAVFPSLQGEDRDERTNLLFRAWRIGQKDRNNGVLLALYLEDRKSRIEVGYGLEPVITDVTCARILREVLAPPLREGRLEEGIEAAVVAIERTISGDANVAGGTPRRRSGPFDRIP